MTIFNGKIHYKWPFSIAMLNYQRVHLHRFKNLRLDALLGCRRCCRCWDLAAALWPWPFLAGPSWSERSLSAGGVTFNSNTVNHGINFSASKSWDAWKPIKKNGIKNHSWGYNLHHLGWLKAYKKKWDKNHLPTAGFRETIHRIDFW